MSQPFAYATNLELVAASQVYGLEFRVTLHGQAYPDPPSPHTCDVLYYPSYFYYATRLRTTSSGTFIMILFSLLRHPREACTNVPKGNLVATLQKAFCNIHLTRPIAPQLSSVERLSSLFRYRGKVSALSCVGTGLLYFDLYAPELQPSPQKTSQISLTEDLVSAEVQILEGGEIAKL